MACGAGDLLTRWILARGSGEEQALWFDPAQVDELVQRLVEYMNDDAYAHYLRERGLAWCRQYTWEKTARETFVFDGLVLNFSHQLCWMTFVPV